MNEKKATASFSIMLHLITLFIATIAPAAAVTWSGELGELPTYECHNTQPSIMQLANGTIYVVWNREVQGSPKIFYMTSSDCGDTWSEEMNFTNTDDQYLDTKPSITQTMNGTIWIVWSSNRPPPPPPPEPDFSIDASPRNLSIPQGGTDNTTIIITSLENFNAPVDLFVIYKPENVTTALDPSQVTPPPSGTANSTLTVSVETTATPTNDTIVVMGKSNKSHTVNIALEITESSLLGLGSPYSTTLQAKLENPQSNSSNYLIYYRTSNDGGTTWSNATQLEPTSTSEDSGPSITQDMNGTVWIVWTSTRSGNQEIHYKNSTDNGTSWSETYQLTNEPTPDRWPSITRTMDGRIWVAWSSLRTGDSEIFCKIYNGTWSNATRLTGSTNDDTTPSILQTADGAMWVFWASCEDSLTARADIFYKYSSDDGATWSDRIPFTTSLEEDASPSTTQTRDSKIWVAWAANGTGIMDLVYKTSLAGDITGLSDEPDGVIDDYDLAFIGNAYGDEEGAPDWDDSKIADLTGPEDPPTSRWFPPDGVIDIYDLAVVGRSYGES